MIQESVKKRVSFTEYGHWNSINNQRVALENMAKNLKIEHMSDWYKVKIKDVEAERGGSSILKKYGNSLRRALQTVYPEFGWEEKRFLGASQQIFGRAPKGYWKQAGSERTCMDSIAKKLHIDSFEGWYKVTTVDVAKCGGGGVLAQHRGSLCETLLCIYPEHAWNLLSFKKVPQGCWASLTRQRETLDKIAAKLGVTELDQWYDIPSEKLKEKGGELWAV